MNIRVVIPTLNNLMLTMMTVHSLQRQTKEVEIVIVDNGSDDRTVAAFFDFPGVTVIENPTRYAYSKSINMGANLPGNYDVLIVSNNDVIWADTAVERLCAGISANVELTLPMSPLGCQSTGIAPLKIVRPESIKSAMDNVDALNAWWRVIEHHFAGLSVVGHPYVAQGGYAFAITRRLFKQLHGFDERYDLFAEDYDLFARATRFTKMAVVNKAYVDHLEHQTVAWIGDERDIRMARNRFRLEEYQTGRKELVSVIIPVYNRYDALCDAIDSVVAQTMPHWRIYVIDDGSPDWDRLQKLINTRYQHLQGLIWAFRRPENRGPGAARNFGLDIANGKYIAFLDSDDIWYREHLEKHYNEHESNLNLGMSFSETDFAWRWFDEAQKTYKYMPDKHPEHQLQNWTYTPERLQNECFIKTSTVFLNSSITQGTNGLRFIVDKNHRTPNGVVEDWEFFKSVQERATIKHVGIVTARTHWAKNVVEESHHSSRLIPWADYTTLPGAWTAKECKLIEPAVCGVVVPTRNRPAPLARILKHLQDIPTIVVADGAESSNYALELTTNSLHGVIELPEVLGQSAARNRGVEYMPCDWIWFLDDDDVPVLSALPAVYAHFNNADCIVAGLLTSTPNGIETRHDICTSGIFVRKEAFSKAGGFIVGQNYAEDVKLIETMTLLGMRIIYEPAAVAIKTINAPRFTAHSRGGAIPSAAVKQIR